MNSAEETISKFLSTLNVDSYRNVKYIDKYKSVNCYCICGQKINTAYLFQNIQNNKKCYVGKNCLKYIAEYLGWNDKS